MLPTHLGRHTHITARLRAGVPTDVVAARAGHSSSVVATTRTVLRDEMIGVEFDDLDDYLSSAF